MSILYYSDRYRNLPAIEQQLLQSAEIAANKAIATILDEVRSRLPKHLHTVAADAVMIGTHTGLAKLIADTMANPESMATFAADLLPTETRYWVSQR